MHAMRYSFKTNWAEDLEAGQRNKFTDRIAVVQKVRRIGIQFRR